MSSITKRISLIAPCLLVFTASVSAQTNLTAKAGAATAPAVSAAAESDRTRDGLTGPVRRVRTEVAKISGSDGRQAESKHVVLELVAYDIKGNKIENQYFPIAGATLTGKEVYKYDEKGNISEMTLLNADGSLLSKEIYKYEFDFAGNWNKMTTSVAVVDARGVTFEPTEITYRSIMYYLDENMVKMVTPSPVPANTSAGAQPVTAPATTATNNAPKPNDPKAKVADNRKGTTTAPALPSASTSATKLVGGGTADGRTAGVTNNQNVPLVSIDEPPPSAAPRPILKPVSGGVLNGTALALPPPIYPETAKRMRTAGTVTVDVVLDESGKVVSATATSGPTVLRDAAVQAALKARFSPTKLSGQPVKVSGVINYKFALVP
jgi:periplasmic protein TonB